MDELEVDEQVPEDAFFVVEGKLQEIGGGYEDFEVAQVFVSHLSVSFVVNFDFHVTGDWRYVDGLKLLIPSADAFLAVLRGCFEFALAAVVIDYAVDISESAEEVLIGLYELQVEHADLELDVIVEGIDDVVVLRLGLLQELTWGLAFLDEWLLL